MDVYKFTFTTLAVFLCSLLLAQPTNDNCADAIPITVGTECTAGSYTSIGSTSEDASVAPNPSCSGYQGGDVWFTFQVPASGNFRVESDGNRWVLYTGSCGTFTQIACDPDVRNFSDLSLAGQTLYLRAYSTWSSEGSDFTLCIWEQPVQPNDFCVDAISLTVGQECTAQNFSSIYTTSEPVDVAPNPTSCNGYLGGDVWFKFDVPASGNFRIETSGTLWTLYSGTCGNFTQLRCDGDDHNISDLSLAGQTLYLRAYKSWSDQGSDFTVCIWEQPVQPNDFCVDAINLTLGQGCNVQNFSSIYTTSEPVDVAPNPSCNGYLGGDVWFKFDVPASGNFRIETSGTLWTLYSGTCGNFTQIRCEGNNHNFRDPSLAGQTLYLRAYKSWSDQGSDFTVCIWEQPVQPNDFCADAISLTVGQECTAQNFSSVYTTSEPVDVAANPSCGFYYGGDVWFTFEVPASGNFRVEMDGNEWALYSGTCGSFTEIRCEGNNHNFSDPSLAGQTLYLRAFRWNSDQGLDFTLCIWEQPTQPNDFCADAINIVVGQSCVVQNFSTLYTTAEPTDVAANPTCGFYYGGDVWFTFDVPASGDFRIEVDGNEWVLYSGSCGNFTQILCAGDSRNFSDPSLAGETLFLRTFRWNSDQGADFTLCIWEIDVPENNLCSNATNILLSDSCIVQSFTTRYSTAEDISVAENPSCGFYYGGDVWFTFTAPESGQFALNRTANSNGGTTQFEYYTGTCGNFQEIVCSGDSETSFNDPALGGELITVRAFSWNSRQGADFDMCIRNTTVAPNDNCADAIALTVGDSCTFETFDSYNTTHEDGIAPAPECGYYQGGDVWFTFEVPPTGQFQVNRNNLGSGSFNYALYTGTCGTFVEYDCSTNSTQSIFDAPELANQTVYLRVFRWNSQYGGEFELCIVAGDCNGDVGGTSFIDNCGDCVGGNTGLEPCVQDCNGVYGGTAYLDDCATCVGGNTGQAPCVQDCNGDWGGTAYIDDCEECVGGSTGLEPCSFDCPTLLANIGDACDDNDPNTSNDTVTNDCECAGEGPVTENTALLCSDGIDNDGNGLIDCEDPACQELFNNLGCLTCFEDGSSFADSVIAYVPICTQINPLATDPNSALGVPDYSGEHSQAVSLGRGYIKLAFTNNTLVNSGTEDPDLYVFEVGPLVEPSFIELRPLNPETELQLLAAGIIDSDGDGYYEFGAIGGSLASVDIDAFFNGIPANSLFFDAIKIVDGPGNCSTNTPGADIDGVCALSNIACNIGEPCDDGDPTTINETLNVNCDCVGESIYDCPELSANIGDACDDGDASTENDEVTADCQCAGVPVYIDCNGDWDGTAYLDNCETCVGGNTGLDACIEDCNGDWGGTAYLDDCETCVGGNTGLEACVSECNGDIEVPVITLLGDPLIKLCVGESYTDAGATALDNCDGDLTSSIVTVNPVNINVAGSYTVTYNVADQNNNQAAEVTRTVEVMQMPTVANAGSDQTVPETCGQSVAVLDANTPLIGTGEWTIVSGIGGILADNTDPQTTLIGLPGETYELLWTISNSPCTPSTDTILVTFENISPQLVGVSPAPGDYCRYDDSFVWTIQASDANLYALEIDHSMELTLPEFTVYADTGNTYGSQQAADNFAAVGVSVTYDNADQKWTINFGTNITQSFIDNGGITFYTVLKDCNGNELGSMSSTTPSNTFAYVLHAEPDVNLAFNGQTAGYNAEFDYCYGEELTVSLSEVLQGEAPFEISWTVAEDPSLDGTASNLGLGDELFSSVLDAGTYTISVASIIDGNGCEIADLTGWGATVVVYEELTLTLPADISVNNSSGLCEAEVSFAATAGGEPNPSMTYAIGGSPITSPHSFPVGITVVDVELTSDCATLIGSFHVEVIDNESPNITCAPSGYRDVNQQNNMYEVVGSEFDPIAVSDNCTAEGDITITHNAASLPGVINTGSDNSSLAGWQFPEGLTTVTFTVTDDATNAATCTAAINVARQTLTGTAVLNSACGNAEVRIRFYEPSTSNEVFEVTTTVVNGEFEADLAGLAPGNYDVFVKVERYLQKKFPNVEVSESGSSIAVTFLKIGDIAGNQDSYNDNLINSIDLSLFLIHYNSTQGETANYNSRSDLNCDGKVDALDLSLLSINYNQMGAIPAP